MKKHTLLLLSSMILLTTPCVSSCSNPETTEVKKDYKDVKDYDLGNGIKYTGTTYNGLIDGEGTIKYPNKDVLVGYFIEGTLDSSKDCKFTFKETGYIFNGLASLNEKYDFNMIEGKLELNNKRSYTGKFKDNLYEDENGTFDFGTNTKYVGPFVKGSNVGQIGTIYYPPSVMEGEGVWYFTGKMASLGKFELNQLGKGVIKFGDWSIYSGEIYHDTDKGWWRKGKGEQDFTRCTYNASIAGGPSNLYLHKYIGEFDYTVSGWICGNGVMYYFDEDLKPAGHLPGFYKGIKRVSDPTEKVEILEEYKDTKVYQYNPEGQRSEQYQEKYKGKTPDIVFCGDSYMDMWQASFGLANYENDTKDYNCINTGIGGTVGSEWVILSEKLVKDFNPKKVFIHLGFNDLHLGFTIEETIASFKAIAQKLIEKNSSITIHFLGVEPSPAFSSFFDQEIVLNNAIKSMCDESANLVFIDTQNLFIEDGKPVSNLNTYFSSDYVHLNSKGYELWWNKLKGYL